MVNKRPERIFAKRSLGQNFLVDRAVIERILVAFDPRTDDTVLEIGPGRGALTEALIERAGRAYALEFDRTLAAMLRERFAGHENFTLIEDDALNLDFASLETGGRKIRLIANLPYNISTAILQRLFVYRDVFSDCLLMFQREVVDRITAVPGNKERGFLTVMTEAHFEVERQFDVAPGSFKPAPKVWSSVVKMIPKSQPIENPEVFRDLVSTAFVQKRKTILNNLKTKFANAESALMASGIDPNRRAETLTLEEWQRLARYIS